MNRFSTIAQPDRSGSSAYTWVALSEPLGEVIWSRVIAKGAFVTREDDAEVMQLPDWAGRVFDPGTSLFKHRGAVQYVKRVPTGKFRTTKTGKPGAMIYRYYYKVEHGGGIGNHEDMKAGASFRHGTGEYTIHSIEDGKLKVSHSDRPGEHHHMTRAELAAKLAEHHGAAIDKHREKLIAEIKEAKQYGTKKQVDRLIDEMKRKGLKPPAEAWEEWGDRPKNVPVDFTGHPMAEQLAKVPADHFVAYTVKKVGNEVAKRDSEGNAIKGEKIRVDNARVLVHMVTGFDYGQLMADSQTALDKLSVDAMVEKASGLKGWGGKKVGWVPVTREHVEEAFAKVRESVAKSLAKEHDKESGRRPLMVNGQRVPGVSVYRGDETAYTGAASSTPSPASIYVAGIKVHSVELEPADNPTPETQSNPVTVARKMIERLLPFSHYRSYRLDPDEDWSIRIGPNQVITRENIQELYKAAFMRRKPFAESDFVTFAEEGWNPDDPSSYAGTISGVIDLSYLGIGDDEGDEGDEEDEDGHSIEKALPGGTWVPLEHPFGEKLWRCTALAKSAGTGLGPDVRALPWWAALKLDPAGLFKAGSPKYIKRVPTGNPKRPWRYFYRVQHGGGVHNAEHFTEGASFAHGDGHYTIHGVKDGKLTVSHSSDGKKESMTHAELAARLAEHHKGALDAHKAKLTREHADAVASGNAKGAEKIRAEAAKIGHEIKAPKAGSSATKTNAGTKERTAAELHAAADRAEKDAARYGEVPRTWDEYKNKEAALNFARSARAQALEAEKAEAQQKMRDALAEGRRDPLYREGDGKAPAPKPEPAPKSPETEAEPAPAEQEALSRLAFQSPEAAKSLSQKARELVTHERTVSDIETKAKQGAHADLGEKEHKLLRAELDMNTGSSERRQELSDKKARTKDEAKAEVYRLALAHNEAKGSHRAVSNTIPTGYHDALSALITHHEAKHEMHPETGLPDYAHAKVEERKAMMREVEARNRQGAPAEVAKRPEPSAAAGPSHADHLAAAKSTYGLSDKDIEHVAKHDYAKKAHEHAQAGDHEKAKGLIKLAVQDRLARDPERNMSPSSAARYMKDKERAAGLKKAFWVLLRGHRKIAA